MRFHSLMVAAIFGAACGGNTLETPDMADDFGIADLSGDIASPLNNDLMVNVLPSQFDVHLAQAVCMHLAMCGQLDAANMAACVQANTNAEAADRDTEVLKGRFVINEYQCLAAIMGSRCDGEDSGAVFIGNCFKFL